MNPLSRSLALAALALPLAAPIDAALVQAGLTPERAAALARAAAEPQAPAPADANFTMPSQAELRALVANLHGVSELHGWPVGYGPGFKTLFEPGAVDFRVAGGGSVRLALASVTRGGETLYGASAGAQPSVGGNTVEYDHGGGLVERYDVGLGGIEQSFVFAAPLPGSGDLVVRLALETDLYAEAGADGLRFLAHDASAASGERGVAIGAVLGLDAAGRSVAGECHLEGAVLELVLPHDFVATASYPLVLDPPIGPIDGWGALDTPDRSPALAFDETNQRYLLVWVSEFSGTDWDIYGALIPVSGASFLLQLDISLSKSEFPDVANINETNRFLVVYQDGPATSSSDRDILALSVDPSSGVVVGTANMTNSPVIPDLAPGVTGDPVLGFQHAVLVWKGGMPSTLQTAMVDVPASGNPSIVGPPVQLSPTGVGIQTCKGMGGPGHSLVVWREGEQLVGRIVRYDGALVGATTVLAPFQGVPTYFGWAVDGDGDRFLVAYVSRIFPAPTPWSVGYVRADFDGTTLSADVPKVIVSPTASDILGPDVGTTRHSQLIVWQVLNTVKGLTVDTGKGSICETSTTISSNAEFDVPAIASTFSATDPSATSSGNALVAWQEIPTGGTDVFIHFQAWSTGVTSIETPYNSASAPNTPQFLPGQTSGPVLGKVWNPKIVPIPGEPTLFPGTFLAGAQADIPGVFPAPAGTLLINLGGWWTSVTQQNPTLQIPVPNDCTLTGKQIFAQGGYLNAAIVLRLTNGLALTIGNE